VGPAPLGIGPDVGPSDVLLEMLRGHIGPGMLVVLRQPAERRHRLLVGSVPKGRRC